MGDDHKGMTAEQLGRAIGLEAAALLLTAKGGKHPRPETVRDYIRYGYRPRGHRGEPAYLRAAMLSNCYVTLPEWCAEFEAARARLGEAVTAAKKRRATPRATAAQARAANLRAAKRLRAAGYPAPGSGR